jgi:uncharacterized membrane protein (UPF0182 family)
MKKGLIWGVSILVVIFMLIGLMSSFIIDYQWFGEVGYLGVFFTSLKAHIMIFAPSFAVIFLLVDFYLRYLRRNYFKAENLSYTKKQLRFQGRIINIGSAVLSLITSLMFTNLFWYRILEFLNATDFNIKDPIFGLDAGFYVFRLPLLQAVLGVLITIIVILTGITLAFYALLKARDKISSLRGFINGEDSPQIRFIARQLATFGAILLLLLSGVFYVKALNLVYSPRGVAIGASYTDVHVTLPMYRIISVGCIISAFVVAIAIIRKKIKWVIFTGAFIIILMFSEVLISGAVEKFIVAPNARDKEMPYLTYNIDLTRKAFGLDSIEEKSLNVDNTINAAGIEKNKDTVDNIRITEFSQSLEVYNQIQAIRNYYKFNDVDIDRYSINGALRQVFIAPRELDTSGGDPRFQTWQNKHLFYTHGYGAVMSYTNAVASTGLPEFLLKDIPAVGNGVKLDRPQLYFGEINDDYIIVDAKSNEIDYPSGNENKENRYEGTGGIKLNPLNRILFAINNGSANFLLSNDITSNSKIILNRNIVNRIEKIAPFISYDSDPYLVVSNGRMYWIIDGYTMTNRFPFSEVYNGVNYIRNSVKVVVDAYDGKVDFYLSDTNDAIAKTIGKIYGGIFKDLSSMPEDLRSHLRYSEDVFLLQARVYEKYHMKNPGIFYNSQDLWSIAKYKDNSGQDVEVEPVYQVMRLPGEADEEFLLTIPYTIAKKENMVSWLAVRMDKNLAQAVVVKFPEDKAIYGPQQFNSKINTDTAISSSLTLWGQQGSQVIFGETNIIPIENSLLYVKPLYLKAQGGKSLPELKRVIVQLGDRIVMADNIHQAFASLFNTEIDTTAPDNENPQEETITDLVNMAADLFNKSKDAQTKGARAARTRGGW